MPELILVLGGARSGKSHFAQQLAERRGGDRVLFVATAEAGDEEMAQRIATHQRQRPPTWSTLEQPRNLGLALDAISQPFDVVLIDCLTLLVSNALLQSGEPLDAKAAQRAVDDELGELLSSLAKRSGTAIVVSSEVGLGLVPETPPGRLYRDLLGWANQKIARQAQATYWMVAGLALDIRRLATELEQAASLDSVAKS